MSSITGSSSSYSPQSDKQNGAKKLVDRSPASREYPQECIDFGKFSMQEDNKAVKYRTAHLRWLLDNNVFTLNSTNDWQTDLRHWTPSSSARYPLRIKTPKSLTDPEALPEDYQVHVYHSKQERMWVKQWIIGMLEAKRFNITTNRQPSRNASRVILILTPELFNEQMNDEIHGAIQGKTVLGIKLRGCDVAKQIQRVYSSYIDLTTVDPRDFTFHIKFMFRVLKALKLPLSICST